MRRHASFGRKLDRFRHGKIRVVEAKTIPKTEAEGSIFFKEKGAGMEPIGMRVITQIPAEGVRLLSLADEELPVLEPDDQ